MTVFPGQAVPRLAPDRPQRRIALVRAGVAVVWAVVFLAVLHGRRVTIGGDIPLWVGLLLSAYPLIDIVALLFESRTGLQRSTTYPALVIDVVAVVGLLVATIALHTSAVLIVFGAWAFAAGLMQLVHAWRADGSRRGQLPLLLSGAISAIAGISFAALAREHTTQLTNLGGYAILGAVFFLVWTVVDRAHSREPGETQRQGRR